jgi:phage anti-repressor protein
MDTSFNIVGMIENNPRTKLSGDYSHKLVSRIQECFTDTQQKMFVSSFFCYMNYNSITDFVIDLDKIWKWLGFTQKFCAKRLLEKHFVLNKDYKSAIHENQQENVRGGHNKETITMTIHTFKLFCIKAGTSKANEIHEYFVKLEELIHENVYEKCDTLKQQLSNITNSMLNDSYDAKIMREQLLLREFGSIGSMIYIIRVKTFDDGKYVVKIGESQKGVKGRYSQCKTGHGDVLLLDCFSVVKCIDFEQMLHSHNLIRPHRVTDLPGHETERELFMINNGLTYKSLLHIIQSNIKQYDSLNDSDISNIITGIDDLKQTVQTLVQQQSISGIEPKARTNTSIQASATSSVSLEQLMNRMDRLEYQNQDMMQALQTIVEKIGHVHTTVQHTRTTTGFNQPLATLGPRLQRIHPDTLQIDKVYETVTECMREYNFQIKRPSLTKSIEQNTVYHGFRWALVARDQDQNVVVDVAPTRPTRIQMVGYIAKMNPEKTEILNVYLDRKTAAKSNGYIASSALDNPVKLGTVARGFVYVLYEKCGDELKNAFTERAMGGRPVVLYVDGIGQYDGHQQLVREFSCKYECVKQIGISDKTLTKSIERNEPYHNMYYRRLGQRVKALDD